MCLKHRYFYWPAMSSIISPMIESFESYSTSTTQSTSRSQRFYGNQASQSAVDDFVWRVRADSRIKQGEGLASTPVWA